MGDLRLFNLKAWLLLSSSLHSCHCKQGPGDSAMAGEGGWLLRSQKTRLKKMQCLSVFTWEIAWQPWLTTRGDDHFPPSFCSWWLQDYAHEVWDLTGAPMHGLSAEAYVRKLEMKHK